MSESEPDWMLVPAGSHCIAEGYETPIINTDAAFYRSFGTVDEFARYVRLFRDPGWLGRVALVVLFPLAVLTWLLADGLWKTRERQQSS